MYPSTKMLYFICFINKVNILNIIFRKTNNQVNEWMNEFIHFYSVNNVITVITKKVTDFEDQFLSILKYNAIQ